MAKKYYACFYVDSNYGEIFLTWDECQKKIKGKKFPLQIFSYKRRGTKMDRFRS